MQVCAAPLLCVWTIVVCPPRRQVQLGPLTEYRAATMFVEDLRTQFYQRLIGKRILVIVNYDIDAICASKILQALFKYDNMLYSIVPIMGIMVGGNQCWPFESTFKIQYDTIMQGMVRAFNENKDDVKFVLLVNCGGCIDLVDLLQPEPDVVFFVCDSHRPYDICNVYSDQQVRQIFSYH